MECSTKGWARLETRNESMGSGYWEWQHRAQRAATPHDTAFIATEIHPRVLNFSRFLKKYQVLCATCMSNVLFSCECCISSSVALVSGVGMMIGVKSNRTPLILDIKRSSSWKNEPHVTYLLHLMPSMVFYCTCACLNFVSLQSICQPVFSAQSVEK